MPATNVVGGAILILGLILYWLGVPYADFLCPVGFLVALFGLIYSKIRQRATRRESARRHSDTSESSSDCPDVRAG